MTKCASNLRYAQQIARLLNVLIRPAVHHINLLDKVVVADVAMLGEQATEEMLPQIKRSVSWPVRISKRIFGVTQ